MMNPVVNRAVGPVMMDLFAGCGGLSLGLEGAGFEPVFVNELHPSAMATYLMNRSSAGLLQRSENQSGDVLEITRVPGELEALATRLRRQVGEIGLIAGGPPCQGFSGIGHRRSFEITREEIPSNHLYREMASIISSIGPRAFLFENVKGLLSSRWTPDGVKGEIWEDVQEAFRQIRFRKGRRLFQYHVFSGLVFAKNFGVPQNRPRVIVVGIREDVSSRDKTDAELKPLLSQTAWQDAPDLVDLLDDISDRGWQKGPTLTYPKAPRNPVQERFRMDRSGDRIAAKGDLLSEQHYSQHSEAIVAKFAYMIANDGEIPASMRTKKFAQRVLPKRWSSTGPSITATSLPDDYVHYSLPRTPTVREWARIQTFPDWYEFAGRRTTGGRRRAGDPSSGNWDRDVPKYTQIGNAVPVLMAEAIGIAINRLIA